MNPAHSIPGAAGGARRALEPVERVSELLFGLIMVLSFTGSLSVAQAGHDDVRAMLIGALGCNLAWGIIDAVLYLMGRIASRNDELRILHAVRASDDPAHARGVIAGALPDTIAASLDEDQYALIHARMKALPDPPPRASLNAADWRGALAVFLWVFVGTLPVVIPFMVMHDARPAMRVSNAVAMTLLFLTGFVFGRCAGRNPWLTGLAMLVLGGVLVVMTIALGG